MAASLSLRFRRTAPPTDPPAYVWQNWKRPSNTGQSSPTLKRLSWRMCSCCGGGYTVRNVARCWAYETGVLLGTELEDKLPPSEYLEYYGPHYRLHYAASNMENQNSAEYLATVRTRLLDNLSKMKPAPSVPFHQTPGEAPRVVAEREAGERRADEADPNARGADAGADGIGGGGGGEGRGGGGERAPQETPVPAAVEAMEVDGR